MTLFGQEDHNQVDRKALDETMKDQKLTSQGDEEERPPSQMIFGPLNAWAVFHERKENLSHNSVCSNCSGSPGHTPGQVPQLTGCGSQEHWTPGQ